MATTRKSTRRVGKRGSIVIPAALRARFGMTQGSLVTAEDRGDGVLIRPLEGSELEDYSAERVAEFLLNNCVDEADYAAARAEVRRLDIDPDAIPHLHPTGA
jgi:AbrB family looped-hinge helix DNA binding protein